MQCVAGHVSFIETSWATWGSQSGEASCHDMASRLAHTATLSSRPNVRSVFDSSDFLKKKKMKMLRLRAVVITRTRIAKIPQS